MAGEGTDIYCSLCLWASCWFLLLHLLYWQWLVWRRKDGSHVKHHFIVILVAESLGSWLWSVVCGWNKDKEHVRKQEQQEHPHYRTCPPLLSVEVSHFGATTYCSRYSQCSVAISCPRRAQKCEVLVRKHMSHGGSIVHSHFLTKSKICKCANVWKCSSTFTLLHKDFALLWLWRDTLIG